MWPLYLFGLHFTLEVVMGLGERKAHRVAVATYVAHVEGIARRAP